MFRTRVILLLAALLAVSAPSAEPVGTSFTYQGELRFIGLPANGAFDFEFALFAVESGGTALAVETVADQPVALGLFTVELDYTDVPFAASQAYWIEVRVREGTSAAGYQPLLPRQKVTPSPFAINARGVQSGGVGTAALADGAVTTSKITDGTIGAADVDTAQIQRRITSTCTAGQAIRGVDAAGAVACQPVGTGTVTSVATAGGLTGGPIVGSGTISIADGGVGSAKITDGSIASVDIQDGTIGSADLASGSVASAEIVDGTIVAADVDSASLQLRVSGSCSGGITRVNADGSAVCSTAVPIVRPVMSSFWQLHQTANGATSVAIGTDGLPLVAVHDVVNGDLVVVHCENAGCTQTTATAIDTVGDVGAFNSIGIGRTGFGVVSYHDATNGDLRVAVCNDLACTSAQLRTIDSAGSVGKHTSLGFTGFNRPVIAYYDESNGNLKLAVCVDEACANPAELETVDASANDVGRNASLQMFMDVVAIAYHDATAGTLKLVRCSFGACTGATAAVADANATSGAAISMIRTASGFPAVFYSRNASIHVLRCTNVQCGAFTPGTLVANVNATFLSGSSDALGHPVIAFVGVGTPKDELGFLRCSDPFCNSAYRSLNTTTASPGFSAPPSIALGHHGFPVITLRSGTRSVVYVCDNHACGFGVRAR